MIYNIIYFIITKQLLFLFIYSDKTLYLFINIFLLYLIKNNRNRKQ